MELLQLLAHIFIFHGAVNQTWALNILSTPSINPPISTSSELEWRVAVATTGVLSRLGYWLCCWNPKKPWVTSMVLIRWLVTFYVSKMAALLARDEDCTIFFINLFLMCHVEHLSGKPRARSLHCSAGTEANTHVESSAWGFLRNSLALAASHSFCIVHLLIQVFIHSLNVCW